MRQDQNHSFKGLFYLPENTNDKVPGILTWNPEEGAYLELIGGFLPQPTQDDCDSIIENPYRGTIYGELTSNKHVSIWDAYQSKGTTYDSSDRASTETWRSMLIGIGIHTDPEKSDFKSASLNLDNLYYLTNDGRFCPPQWTKIQGVDNPYKKLENGTRLMPYTLPVVGGFRAKYATEEIDNIKYCINTYATRPFVSEATEAMPDFKLDMMTSYQQRGPVITLQTVAQANIELLGEHGASASNLIEYMSPFIDLLRLTTFKPCGIEEITLTTTHGKEVPLLLRFGESAKPEEKHKPYEIIFTLEDVSLSSYLNIRADMTWGHQAAYAWGVLVGLCGYSSRYIGEYIGQSVACAEGFHSWCLNIDPGGSTNLRDRLEDLYDQLPEDIRNTLKLNVDNWTQWAVWARNHVAHGGTKRRKIISDSMSLFAVARVTHLVTYLAAIHKLGVSSKKILEALQGHPRLRAAVGSVEKVNHIDAPAESS